MSQSQFKTKLESLRLHKIETPAQHDHDSRHICSAQIKIRGACSHSPRTQLLNQNPIIICKKERKQDRNRKEIQKVREVKVENRKALVKKVEPFVPIDVPISPRSKLETKFKYMLDNTEASTPNNKKQIQIHIEKDMKDNKQCLKKLFKKIHKLTEDLAESQKQRIRLQLQLNNLKNIDGVNRGNQKDLLRLEGQNYKLRSDIDFLKDLLKQRNDQITALKNKVPSQVIKQVVVEKPVQVRVEVPKYVPGPQKIVEVSKFVQNKSLQRELQTLRKKVADLESDLAAQRRKYNQDPKIVKQRQQIEVPVVIEKPVYLDKPIYIDRPVYIQKPVQKQSQRIIEVPKQVQVQVPIEVPVYIDKPVIDQEIYRKLGLIQQDMELCMRENEELRAQNAELRYIKGCLQNNLEILKRHNCQKNHQVEVLLRNADDYNPLHLREKIRQEVHMVRSPIGSSHYRNAEIYQTFKPNP